MEALTRGIHHLGLTVSDLEASRAFFTSLLGWREVRRTDYPAVFVSDGMVLVTLWESRAAPPGRFDRERNVGLHHAAFAVASEAALEDLYRTLVEHEVRIEFKPEPLGHGPAMHMICYEPSGCRIEFIWPGR